jgi:chromosome partitioning protein
METIGTIRDRLNPDLKIEGILRTMYDPRNKLTTEVSSQLFSYFGDTVYRTVVPRNVRLAEAPSYGIPVIKYDRHSRGALAYLALAGELLRRNDEAAAGISG